MRRVVLDGFLEGKMKGSPGAGVSTPVGSDALGGEIVSLLVQGQLLLLFPDGCGGGEEKGS